MNDRTSTTTAVSLLLLALLLAPLGGCGQRSVVIDDPQGNGGTEIWTAPPIPPRPAGQKKIPIGVMIGIEKEQIALYPELKKNNIGLGLQYVVRETLAESDWFTLCTVDPKMIVAMEKLRDYYWHGEVPEGKQTEAVKPEYILMVGLTRVDLIGKERMVGGARTFRGNCSVKVNFESYSMFSAYPTVLFPASGKGTVRVSEKDSLFNGGSESRSSAFAECTERALRSAVPTLIAKFKTAK